jgi:hypothetical protein
MINESKQAIKQVFESFDKDKSGFVDVVELGAIAKELNTDLQKDEVDKVLLILIAAYGGSRCEQGWQDFFLRVLGLVAIRQKWKIRKTCVSET